MRIGKEKIYDIYVLTFDILKDIIKYMNKRLIYTSDDHLKELMKDPDFCKAWTETEPEYLLATQLIEKRLKNKMSQRDLAKKVKTTQAVISRIETMQANPSLSLLKRISNILGTKLTLEFR